MDLDEAKRNIEDQIILWQQKEFRSLNASTLYYIECRERIEALQEVMKIADAFTSINVDTKVLYPNPDSDYWKSKIIVQ